VDGRPLLRSWSPRRHGGPAGFGSAPPGGLALLREFASQRFECRGAHLVEGPDGRRDLVRRQAVPEMKEPAPEIGVDLLGRRLETADASDLDRRLRVPPGTAFFRSPCRLIAGNQPTLLPSPPIDRRSPHGLERGETAPRRRRRRSKLKCHSMRRGTGRGKGPGPAIVETLPCALHPRAKPQVLSLEGPRCAPVRRQSQRGHA
jgi:hypothetical protein